MNEQLTQTMAAMRQCDDNIKLGAGGEGLRTHQGVGEGEACYRISKKCGKDFG